MSDKLDYAAIKAETGMDEMTVRALMRGDLTSPYTMKDYAFRTVQVDVYRWHDPAELIDGRP